MYVHSSGGTTAAHLIVKRPILGPLAVGAVAAGMALGGNASSPPPEHTVNTYKVPEQSQSQTQGNVQYQTDHATPTMSIASSTASVDTPPAKKDAFEGIKMAESSNRKLGAHPDGKSFGPAGLTKNALKDVVKGLKEHEYDVILSNPVLSEKYAKMYFDRLVKYYGDEDTAIVAYHHGIGRVNRMIKAGKPLPKEYLTAVRSNQTMTASR